MDQWNVIFDVNRCTGCANCVVSLQDEYVGNDFPGYTANMPRRGQNWMKLSRRDAGQHPVVDVSYLVTACSHCLEAPCLTAGEKGAVRRRRDGIIIIDPVKAKGQKQIADACPYGAVSWNEDLSLPQIWSFDAHLLDSGWTEPRPVQACPTAALTAIKVSDIEMARIVARDGLRPAPGRRPGLFHYKNLDRHQKHFIAGTLVDVRNDTNECAEGVEVHLDGEGSAKNTISDPFGVFRFSELDAGTYRVTIKWPGKPPVVQTVTIEDSTYLGEMHPDRSTAG